MSISSDEEPDDWMNSDRSPKTGRILKGRSGNLHGRPKKPKGEALPFELAQAILAAGATEFEVVNKKTGRKEKVTGINAILKQLVIAGANGDKGAARQYMTYVNNAARTVELRAQRLYERLGAYLKSVDDGRPWKIDANEAEFYQKLADEAAMRVTIQAYDHKPTVESLTAEELDGVLELANLRLALGDRFNQIQESDLKTIARRIIYAERRQKLRQ